MACPLVAIAVSSPSGPSHLVDALIDTGFTGFVQLPERRARELGLTRRAVSEAQYADGRTGTGTEADCCSRAISANRHSAFINRICALVLARDSRRGGLATMQAKHIAREAAALGRLAPRELVDGAHVDAREPGGLLFVHRPSGTAL
jgi:hypothetical protein